MIKTIENKTAREFFESEDHREIVRQAAILGAQDQDSIAPPTTDWEKTEQYKCQSIFEDGETKKVDLSDKEGGE